MAFCSNCGGLIDPGARFCSACGLASKATPPQLTSGSARLKPFGGILLAIAAFFLLMAMMRYNFAESQLLSGFGGGTDPAVAGPIIWGLACALVGVLLFTSEPAVFLKLNRTGLVVLLILMALMPLFAWITWLIPGLRERHAPQA